MSDRQHAKPWNGPDLSEPGSDVLWSKYAGAERGGVSTSRLNCAGQRHRATTHTANQAWILSIGSIHDNLDVGFVIGLRAKVPIFGLPRQVRRVNTTKRQVHHPQREGTMWGRLSNLF